MCYRQVERNDANAAENIVQLFKEKALSSLMEKLPQENEIDEFLVPATTQISQDEIIKKLDEYGAKTATMPALAKAASKAAASKSTTNAKTTNARGRGKAAAAVLKAKDANIDEDDDDDVMVVTKAPAATTSSRGGARGRGRATTNSRANTTRAAMPQLDVSINSSTVS